MVTDEMIEAGCLAAVEVTGFNPKNWPNTYPDAEQLRKVVRAVLATALQADAREKGSSEKMPVSANAEMGQAIATQPAQASEAAPADILSELCKLAARFPENSIDRVRMNRVIGNYSELERKINERVAEMRAEIATSSKETASE